MAARGGLRGISPRALRNAPAGNVVARTGRVYYIAIGPVVTGKDMFDTGGAIAAAATCGSHDFLDCGPPPGSGEAIPGREELCSLEPPPPPSADPGMLRRAAAAYADAEKTALTAKRALDEKYPTNPTFKQAHTYYRELQKVDVAFLYAIYALETSFDTIHDFNLLAPRPVRLGGPGPPHRRRPIDGVAQRPQEGLDECAGRSDGR